MERAEERLRMEPRDILNILNWDLTVTLGRERNRYHKLFYSEVDQDWFVAICDERTREVVTILPYDYHHRWMISQEAMDDARNIAESGKKKDIQENYIEDIPVRPDPNDFSKTLQSVINVLAIFRTHDGGLYRSGICRLSIEEYGNDKEAILRNPLAIDKIKTALQKANPEKFHLHSLYLRIGRKGALIPFKIRELVA